jgi:hypothetical protein
MEFLFLLAILLMLATIVLYIVRGVLIVTAKTKYQFEIPKDSLNLRYNPKQLRQLIASGKIENPQLVKLLSSILLIELIMKIAIPFAIIVFAISIFSESI